MMMWRIKLSPITYTYAEYCSCFIVDYVVLHDVILLTYVELQTVVGAKQFGRSSQFGTRKREPNCDDPPDGLVPFTRWCLTDVELTWTTAGWCMYRFTFIEKEQLSLYEMSLPGKMEPCANGVIVLLLTRKRTQHWHNEVSSKCRSWGQCIDNTFVWKIRSHIDISVT